MIETVLIIMALTLGNQCHDSPIYYSVVSCFGRALVGAASCWKFAVGSAPVVDTGINNNVKVLVLRSFIVSLWLGSARWAWTYGFIHTPEKRAAEVATYFQFAV